MESTKINHPVSGEILEGRVLGKSDILQKGDMFSSYDGEWKPVLAYCMSCKKPFLCEKFVLVRPF